MRAATLLRRPALRHVLALGFYTILALGLTWPLLAHFTTHVTGDGVDDPALAWNLWWAKVRLVDQINPDLFHAGWMFHPIDINLAFYTLTPLNGLLSLPLQTAFSLVVANNVLLLAAFVLGGYGAFLLAYDLLNQVSPRPTTAPQDPLRAPIPHAFFAALFAGVVYAFASAKLFYAALGQFNIASSQWIPFCALYLVRTARAATMREAMRQGALAGLFLVLQSWAELTYATFLLIFAALLLLWRLAGWLHDRRHTEGAIPPQVWGAGGVVTGLVFLAGIAPFLWAMLPDLRVEGDFFGAGGGFADVFSADLMGYLAPTRLHPWFGAWAATLPFPNDKGQQIFLGYGTLLLAIAGIVYLVRAGNAARRLAWLWGGALLLFWLLTLGPHLRWAGQDLPVPGPFALVSRLPFFSGNRYPSRYSVMFLLAAAVLAAAGLRWLLAAASARRATGVLGVVTLLFLVEHLSAPLPLSDFRVPPIYTRLANMAGDGAVLELPTGWRNGARVLGKSDVLIMMQEWYQTTHGMRRLGGNTSRNPAYKFQYFTQAPLIGDLIALMNADRPHIEAVVTAQMDALIEQDRALAAQVLDFLDVQSVVVHVEKSPPHLLRFVEEVLPLDLIEEEHGVDWTGAPRTTRLYRVQPRTDTADTTIRMEGALANLYLGEGWSTLTSTDGVRYATRPAPTLLLDLPERGNRLRLDWVGAGNALTVTVNGQPVAAQTSAGTERRTVIEIPAGVANQPVDQVQIDFGGDALLPALLAQPAGPRGWPIGETGAFLAPAASIVARSAGEEVGDFAQLYVNGRDQALNGRGYNLVAVDADGQVLDRAVFDTFAAAGASTALAEWVAQWPTGTVIAGAAADEASRQLGQPAVDALATLGVAGDLRDRFRWSHAFIGAAGAEPGTAIEQMALIQPVTVAAGLPLESPQVYGGLRAIEVQPLQ